jgi:hypothetical protein
VEKKRLLSQSSSRPYHPDARQSVWTTWELSFQRLQKGHYRASSLLLFLALLNHKDVTLDVLTLDTNQLCHWAESGEFEPVPENKRWIVVSLTEVFSNKVILREMIGILRKYSFVRWKTGNKALTIHPLVHYRAYVKLSNVNEELNQMECCAIGVVSSRFEKLDIFPPTAAPTNQGTIREERTLDLWPWRRYPDLPTHALKCLKYASELVQMSEAIAHQSLALLQVL